MVDAAIYFGAEKETIYVEIPKYNNVFFQAIQIKTKEEC
jgi:hypothetical protein